MQIFFKEKIEMSAPLCLGKMRINKVTCHKISHHYNYLVAFCKLFLSFVSILWSPHTETQAIYFTCMYLQPSQACPGPPGTHQVMLCVAATPCLVMYLIHRWALHLILNILTKDGIDWREFRGEGMNGQRKHEHLVTLADLGSFGS